MIKVLGLTGPIAAGKSTASEFLRKKGGYVLDCDNIAHNVVLKGNAAYADILRNIDGDYLDGRRQIDRKKLGSIVFGDGEKLKKLESIIHRDVEVVIRRKIDSLHKSGDRRYGFVVIDAPLLFESGIDSMCHKVFVVYADRETRASRLMKRDGFTYEEAALRIEVQKYWSTFRKDCGEADVIENNGDKWRFIKDLNSKLREFMKS